MDIIRSRENNRIKLVRSLNSRKNREDEGAFVVEGMKFVREALKENSEIEFILISEGVMGRNETDLILDELYLKDIVFYVCEEKIFDNTADTINSQGILAVVKKHRYDLENVLKESRFIVFCDRIQDPGNLGTIIRTADAFGPASVVLNRGCVDAYNQKVVRATAGAVFRVPIVTDCEDEEIIASLKEAGFKIISSVVESEYSFNEMEKAERICVVIGNEGQGVSKYITDNSEMSITIRMTGRAESLNASIAAGIIIYETRKKLL
jgi:TrmH family RNA methyltransferase